MWKNVVLPDRSHMTKWGLHIACWITKATVTFRIGNAYCFLTARTVTRTRLVLTLHVYCPSCFIVDLGRVPKRLSPLYTGQPDVALPLVVKDRHWIFAMLQSKLPVCRVGLRTTVFPPVLFVFLTIEGVKVVQTTQIYNWNVRWKAACRNTRLVIWLWPALFRWRHNTNSYLRKNCMIDRLTEIGRWDVVEWKWMWKEVRQC